MNGRLLTALIVALILFPYRAAAQNGVAGFRHGPSLWLTRSGIGQGTVKYASGQHFTWDKQLFYRNTLKGKWAYEASLGNYRFKNRGVTKAGRPISERNDILESTVSLQYDVTYPLLGYMFYSMQDMKAYVGFEMTPVLSFNKIVEQDASGTDRERRNTTFSMMLSFSYTHIIPVSKRLNIISRFSFRTNSFSKYQSAAGEIKPNKSIGWHTGLGYTL